MYRLSMIIWIMALYGYSARISACEFTIDSAALNSNTTEIRYDVFSVSTSVRTLGLEITRVDALNGIDNTDGGRQTNTCDAQVHVRSSKKFTKSGEIDSLHNELQPGLIDSSRISKNSFTLVLENILPGERRQIPFDIEIPPEQFVSSGVYVGYITASVGPYRSGINNIPQDGRTSFNIETRVLEGAQVSFAGVLGQAQTVDFGSINEGSVPIFTPIVNVQSTSSFQLRFRSQNNGVMIQNTSTTPHEIPYSLKVAGQTINLTDRNKGDFIYRGSSAIDSNFSLEFTIVDASNKRAGNYNDRVIVDILPGLN